MPKFKLSVSDTISYSREHVVEIEARTLEEAKEIALDRAIAGDYHDNFLCEEIDNTPYEVEAVVDETDIPPS